MPYMSQDGGDGERASGAVSQSMRDLIASGNYDVWGLDFGETEESDENQTVFWLHVSGPAPAGTRFRVVLTKETP